MKSSMRRGPARRLTMVSAVVGLLALGVTGQAQGATLTVCSACTHTSVQSAIDAAAPGDTINVAEPGPVADTATIEVNKANLKVRGYQRNIDPRGGARFDDADESTVNADSGPGFNVTAQGVEINGFTVEGSDPGIRTSGTASGYKVIYNIIEQNTFGLYLNSEGTSNTLVQRNRFQLNNELLGTAAAAGNAIYSDQGANNITVDQNELMGHAEGGIGFFGAGQGSLNITNNVLANDGGIDLINTAGANVLNNRLTSSAFNSVTVNGNSSNILIKGNLLQGAEDGLSNGVNIDDDTGLTLPNSNVDVENNTIRGNDKGVLVEDGGLAFDGLTRVTRNRIEGNNVGVEEQDTDTAQLYAQFNYWGCKTGANTGTCDTTVGDVDESNFLKNPSKTGP